MKTKPIFVCYAPSLITQEEFDNVADIIGKKLKKDYYTICLISQSKLDFSFELFNSELKEKDFEDLKAKLLTNEN